MQSCDIRGQGGFLGRSLGVCTALLACACGSGVFGNGSSLASFTSTKGYSRSFTEDVDFDEGVSAGVNHDQSGELHLDMDVFVIETPFLWVPLSALDQVVRVDTMSGEASPPIPLSLNGETCDNPSRTTVDISFGVWLGCRGSGVDPDDKVVHVSRDGVVDIMLHAGWAARAVALDAYGHLWVGNSFDGTVWEFAPDYENKTAECIRGESSEFQDCRYPPICLRQDGKPCGSWARSDPQVRYDGGTYPYGAMVDQEGFLWIKGGGLYKIDARHPTGDDEDHENHALLHRFMPPTGVCQGMYGMTVDLKGDVWTGGYACNDVKHFKSDGTFVGAYNSASDTITRGVAVDRDGNIWVANSNQKKTDGSWEVGSVSQFDPDGQHLQSVYLEVGDKKVLVTTGVGVDAYGNIWAMGYGSNYVIEFNPNNPTERRAIDTGGIMYTYSDMLGTALRTVTMRQRVATWSATIDSRTGAPTWETISWTAREPSGTSLHVEVRCADTRTDLASMPWQRIDANPDAIPCEGRRFLTVRASFLAQGIGASPALEDLTVRWQTPGE